MAFEELIQGGAQDDHPARDVRRVPAPDTLGRPADRDRGRARGRRLGTAAAALVPGDRRHRRDARPHRRREHGRRRSLRGRRDVDQGSVLPRALPDQRDVWSAIPGFVGVEMELATLLIVAALRGVRAGGAFTVDGNPAEEEKSIYDYNPHRPVVDEGKQRMVTVGLDADGQVGAAGDRGGRKRRTVMKRFVTPAAAAAVAATLLLAVGAAPIAAQEGSPSGGTGRFGDRPEGHLCQLGADRRQPVPAAHRAGTHRARARNAASRPRSSSRRTSPP